MALDNVTSHFSTMLGPMASASFLSSLSIIHALPYTCVYCYLTINLSLLRGSEWGLVFGVI